MNEEPQYKECPKCTVMTEKSGGCNKMSCSNCNSKWCFYCSLEIYTTRGRKRKADMEKFCKDPEGHRNKKLGEEVENDSTPSQIQDGQKTAPESHPVVPALG
jgi:hypothetical protein